MGKGHCQLVMDVGFRSLGGEGSALGMLCDAVFESNGEGDCVVTNAVSMGVLGGGKAFKGSLGGKIV